MSEIPPPLIPSRLTSAEWRAMLLASAHAVLLAREERIHKSQRLKGELVSAGHVDATALRASGPPRRLEFLSWVREHAEGNAQAVACIDAACKSMFPEQATLPDGQDECCFSLFTTDLVQVTLFGNQGPGRTESSHVVHKEWVEFVKALVVVGNLHEWMDWMMEHQWLSPSTRTLDQASFDAIADSEPCTHWRKVFKEAARLLYTSLA